MRLLPERFWAWPRELRRAGVVGINARNLRMLAPLNPRRLYPRVDDKVITKRVCEDAGVPVPETFAVIERFGDVRRVEEMIAPPAGGVRESFVIKPARGAAGRGVMIVTGRRDGLPVDSLGRPLPPEEIRYHLAMILSGLYSLGGRPDRAIVEQRIVSHPAFERLAVGGTPDVRVIVHRRTPVMAMLRLPTRASCGRANLHQGAIGAGVDIVTGVTMGGVSGDREAALHPDTGEPVAGFRVPGWEEVLGIASRLGRALELGYCGVDVVIDAERGPLVLEANARPGLSIQTANRTGLALCLPEAGHQSLAQGRPAQVLPAAAAEREAEGGDRAEIFRRQEEEMWAQLMYMSWIWHC